MLRCILSGLSRHWLFSLTCQFIPGLHPWSLLFDSTLQTAFLKRMLQTWEAGSQAESAEIELWLTCWTATVNQKRKDWPWWVKYLTWYKAGSFRFWMGPYRSERSIRRTNLTQPCAFPHLAIYNLYSAIFLFLKESVLEMSTHISVAKLLSNSGQSAISCSYFQPDSRHCFLQKWPGESSTHFPQCLVNTIPLIQYIGWSPKISQPPGVGE